MNIADLVPIGDKELWVLSKENWSVPLYIMPVKEPKTQETWFAVRLATHVKAKVHLMAWRILETIASFKSTYCCVYKTMEQLGPMIEKAPGVTPEYYYKYRDIEPEPDTTFTADSDIMIEVPQMINEEFLKDVIRRTHLCNLPSLKVIWTAIVQTAMQWLISDNRPVNLGFCTLFAVPYRANWKGILLGSFPKIWSVFSKSEADIEEAVIKSGLADAVFWKELLEIRKPHHTCGWKLECMHNRLWDVSVNKIEATRIGQSKASYAKFIAKSIKRNIKLILAAFRGYVCRSVAPSAAFSTVVNQNQQVLIPWTPRGGINPAFAKKGSADICADSSLDHKKPRLLSAFADEINDVCRLPDARWRAAELRISGGNVEESG